MGETFFVLADSVSAGIVLPIGTPTWDWSHLVPGVCRFQNVTTFAVNICRNSNRAVIPIPNGDVEGLALIIEIGCMHST